MNIHYIQMTNAQALNAVTNKTATIAFLFNNGKINYEQAVALVTTQGYNNEAKDTVVAQINKIKAA